MVDRSQGFDRLPIKLILPKQGAERKVLGGGGPPKPFRPVTPEFRSSLANQVEAATSAVAAHISGNGAAPLRVKVLPNAAAKSHRPEELFSDKTCPIVAGGRLGELFIRATSDGLSKLRHLILSNDSEQMVKELSCIESIDAITPSARRKGVSAADILRRAPRRNEGFLTRVSLFDMGSVDDGNAFLKDFKTACDRRGIKIDSRGYSEGSLTFGVQCRDQEDVEALSRLVSVRSISHMPSMRVVRRRSKTAKSMPNLPLRQSSDSDVPVVVVVDSGISANVPSLESWIVGRDQQVPPEYSNTAHGTFVAGLICFGQFLNPTIEGLDDSPCAIFDLQVIPNDDPEYGDTTTLLEQELLQSLEAALQQYSNKYKVWNLSLGSDTVCSLDEFSALAVELDDLQERYKVSFVIAAGNYDTVPLLDYPRSATQLDAGRITSPADSVLGITVGSISHVDFKTQGPRESSPSPFSRHGAGPNYIIKPDVVHFGGSCSIDAAHVHGIRSLSESGVSEQVGTSFAAPLVSRTLAQIYHQITPSPSPVLARALLTHHARDPRSGFRVPDGEENFMGFGLPSPAPYCLECTPHSATLVFEDVLRPGHFLEWDDFPYPPSLKRGDRYFGEVWMTIAFAPSRGARWGTEYCETHVDAHFGVYQQRVARQTGEISQKFVGLVPPEHRNASQLYETFQVEKMRKWAPVRTYYGDMGEKGQRGLRWRLKLQLLSRHGIDRAEISKPQPFALVVTVGDPTRQIPVYDEMARLLHNRFKAENLAVRTAARLRGQARS
ncbi:hypothetical protein BZM26_36585 [Paraburkholderia strydomiana]|nr:hypothetical protein BZM26_36585 [Paraburkholderia strydomiana]